MTPGGTSHTVMHSLSQMLKVIADLVNSHSVLLKMSLQLNICTCCFHDQGLWHLLQGFFAEWQMLIISQMQGKKGQKGYITIALLQWRSCLILNCDAWEVHAPINPLASDISLIY